MPLTLYLAATQNRVQSVHGQDTTFEWTEQDTKAHNNAYQESVDTLTQNHDAGSLNYSLNALDFRESYLEENSEIKQVAQAFNYYIDSWHKKVEWLGRLNYPAEAIQKQINGELLLSVKIANDGSLISIKILQSSGYQVLDDAAINIVKLAAPFAPLPVQLREQGAIDITRKWRFLRNKMVL